MNPQLGWLLIFLLWCRRDNWKGNETAQQWTMAAEMEVAAANSGSDGQWQLWQRWRLPRWLQQRSQWWAIVAATAAATSTIDGSCVHRGSNGRRDRQQQLWWPQQWATSTAATSLVAAMGAAKGDSSSDSRSTRWQRCAAALMATAARAGRGEQQPTLPRILRLLLSKVVQWQDR